MAETGLAREYKTPYADELPPLSTEEFDALKADIEANGVIVPVDVDEDGNVLDGHHRLKCDPKAPCRVVRGLSDAEKLAYVLSSNDRRRNLSPSQKAELLVKKKKLAARLREEDPKRWTQKEVARVLGVARETVRNWFGTNGRKANTSVPDARVKVPPKARPFLAERVAKGESVRQVAADFGISDRQARTIATKERKAAELKAERKATTAKLGGDTLGIHHGDFREIGHIIDDASVDLIFTDPPYELADIGLYGDLAEFAARVLKPGAWCLAYSGQFHMPAAYDLVSSYLTYGWTFAIWHSGGASRIRKFKLQTGWKPILGF